MLVAWLLGQGAYGKRNRFYEGFDFDAADNTTGETKKRSDKSGRGRHKGMGGVCGGVHDVHELHCKGFAAALLGRVRRGGMCVCATTQREKEKKEKKADGARVCRSRQTSLLYCIIFSFRCLRQACAIYAFICSDRDGSFCLGPESLTHRHATHSTRGRASGFSLVCWTLVFVACLPACLFLSPCPLVSHRCRFIFLFSSRPPPPPASINEWQQQATT